MKNIVIVILTLALLAGIIFTFVYFTGTPSGRVAINTWHYNLRKADDATLYNTRKNVENTCRAMIASYTSDKLKYEQYAKSDDKEQINWGEQAKIRANQTAATYNNYILKNSYVFEGNIPEDIRSVLEYLD